MGRGGAMSEAINVSVPPDAWDDVRGDRRRLQTTLWINGVGHHLEAVEIQDVGAPQNGPRFMKAATPQDDDVLDALDGLYSTRWSSIALTWPAEGTPRRYVVYAVPYAE
jgi:hypothetical protein